MATAYTWLSMYKNSVGKEQGMSVNEINGVFGKQASEMSLKDKFSVVHETASMNDERVGEYCRKHGIYKSGLERDCQNKDRQIDKKDKALATYFRYRKTN